VSEPSPRLLVSLALRPELAQTLNQRLPSVPWGFLDGTPPSSRGNVEAMLVGSFAREAATFDPASTPRLQFVQRIYTGLDGFPFDRFPESVRVAGNVGAFAPFVAEHAVAIALAAARDLKTSGKMVAEGRLRPPPVQLSLFGATALVLGYGEIGRAIAERIRPFGARIEGVNRDGRPVPGCDRMYPSDRLTEALRNANFVFEARPLTRRTVGSIGAVELGAMKPDAVFVNVGRARTVDEEALYGHLVAHREFRAAIDVWWEEEFADGKLSAQFPFAELPNFVGTPHTAGFAPGAEARALEKAVENVGRFFRDGRPHYVVDRSDYASGRSTAGSRF
jgi:phosphoglycerate dehydrogenase-like enzyme